MLLLVDKCQQMSTSSCVKLVPIFFFYLLHKFNRTNTFCFSFPVFLHPTTNTEQILTLITRPFNQRR